MTSRGAPARACDRPASPAQSSVRSPRWSHPETPPPLTLSPLSLASLARTPIPTNNERTPGKAATTAATAAATAAVRSAVERNSTRPSLATRTAASRASRSAASPATAASPTSTPPLHLQGGHVVQGRERQVGLDRTRHMLHPAHAAQPRARRALTASPNVATLDRGPREREEIFHIPLCRGDAD
jgi:hypothetical protein